MRWKQTSGKVSNGVCCRSVTVLQFFCGWPGVCREKNAILILDVWLMKGFVRKQTLSRSVLLLNPSALSWLKL